MYSELSKPFDPGPARAFLTPGCTTRNELNSSLATYVNYLTGITPAEDLLKYKKMLDTDIFLPSGNPDKGEISLMAGLHTLEIMKNGLLTVESYVLNTIANHSN
jgi:hypothetical protein